MKAFKNGEKFVLRNWEELEIIGELPGNKYLCAVSWFCEALNFKVVSIGEFDEDKIIFAIEEQLQPEGE